MRRLAERRHVVDRHGKGPGRKEVAQGRAVLRGLSSHRWREGESRTEDSQCEEEERRLCTSRGCHSMQCM